MLKIIYVVSNFLLEAVVAIVEVVAAGVVVVAEISTKSRVATNKMQETIANFIASAFSLMLQSGSVKTTVLFSDSTSFI